MRLANHPTHTTSYLPGYGTTTITTKPTPTIRTFTSTSKDATLYA